MTFLFILSLGLLLIPREKGAPEAEPLSAESLLPWKGFCTLLILLSHYMGYITETPGDETYLLIRSGMDQTVVVLFFFSAGFGMTRRFLSSPAYLKRLPGKMARVWLLSLVSVLCMLVTQTLRGRSYEIHTVLLALIPFANLGNSPWFILMYLLVCLIFLISFRFAPPPLAALLCCLLTLGLMSGGIAMELDAYWYDSVLLFPLGVFLAFVPDRMLKKVQENSLLWLGLVSISVLSLVWLYCFHTRSLLFHEGYLLSACLILLLVSLRLHPGSRLLSFLGQHALSVYLFQRLPMILMYETGMADMVPHLSFPAVLALICFLALLADTVQARLTAALRARRKA